MMTESEEFELNVARERFQRAVDIEQLCYDVAVGVREMPTKEHLKNWHQYLGFAEAERPTLLKPARIK